jgi:hypothetical protein
MLDARIQRININNNKKKKQGGKWQASKIANAKYQYQ